MNPQNGIIGDDFGTDIPETLVDPNQLDAERRAAKYSRSSEYKKLEAHMKTIIERNKYFLPSGISVKDAEGMTDEELGRRWRAATSVIAEIQTVLDFYENSKEIVKQADK